jgi:hypothetical protein
VLGSNILFNSLWVGVGDAATDDRGDRRYFGRGARIKRKAKRKWGFDGGGAGAAVGSSYVPPRHLGSRRSIRSALANSSLVTCLPLCCFSTCMC